SIEGRVSTGLTFRHADGASYGGAVDPATADACAHAFRALCALGFRERLARDALDQIRARAHVGALDFQAAMRLALAVLSTSDPNSQRRSSGRSEHMGEPQKNLVRLAPPPP